MFQLMLDIERRSLKEVIFLHGFIEWLEAEKEKSENESASKIVKLRDYFNDSGLRKGGGA